MGREHWFAVFAIALGATSLLVPVAIRVAHRTGMLDRPNGWKSHAQATPYLGGVAVVAGILISTVALSPDLGAVLPILGGAAVLLAIGVVDDRLRLHATPRLAIELAAAGLLWKAGLGWSIDAPGLLNFALTALWVIGVINAVNLLDLMDGVAAGTVAAGAAGCTALAAMAGDHAMAALGVAVVASCLGFLPFNLRSPSRIFLGDGGTMPLGFILAALTMATLADQTTSASALVAAACLLGVPLLDLGARVVLRLWRGVSLMTAGPDSLANRLDDLLASPRRVTMVLVIAQGALAALTVDAVDRGSSEVLTLFGFALLGGAAAAIALQASAREPEVSASEPEIAAREPELPLVAPND